VLIAIGKSPKILSILKSTRYTFVVHHLPEDAKNLQLLMINFQHALS